MGSFRRALQEPWLKIKDDISEDAVKI